jgi:ATP-dependent protease ClpP protease subunit
MAEINQQTVHTLMATIENLIKQGQKNILLLISSNGGSVFHGITLYNFLKGCPINLDTYNFGSIDSIAVAIYCAGKNRFCVSSAKFLIHGVSFNIQNNSNFEEKKLEEIVNDIKSQRKNMAKIIAENCNKSQEEIEKIMFEGKTYNPEEAKDLGLVTEIKDNLFAVGEEIIGIG